MEQAELLDPAQGRPVSRQAGLCVLTPAFISSGVTAIHPEPHSAYLCSGEINIYLPS